MGPPKPESENVGLATTTLEANAQRPTSQTGSRPARLRVCLASIHPRMLSGQIETLIALAARLEASGHEVRVVSAFPDESLRATQRWAREHGDGLALAPKVLRIGHIIADIVAAAKDADILHFNVPTPAFGAMADVVQVLTRRPMVVGFEAHLVDLPALASRLMNAPEFYGPRIINNGLVARATVRRARAYVVSSQFQRHELTALGYPPAQVHVIPNLIDDSKLTRWDRSTAREALGLPATSRLIVFVGHYHDVKGHDVLLRAFPAIRATAPDARLVLAWSGVGHQARVRETIAQLGIGAHVIELGRVDIGQLFSAADVVALPYRFSIGQAAYPGTVIEAMWVGAPLVVSDLPLLKELAGIEPAALLARAGDPSDLARKVSSLLANPDLGRSLVAAQRAVVAGRLDGSHLAEQYVDVYRAVVGVPRP